MIRTTTRVACDGRGCHAELVGCECPGHSNREENALAEARRQGWRREWVGTRLADLCPDCRAFMYLTDHLNPPERTPT